MPGEKQDVNTGQRKLKGVKKEQRNKGRHDETTVSETKGGFMKGNTAKCCASVALEFPAGVKAGKQWAPESER